MQRYAEGTRTKRGEVVHSRQWAIVLARVRSSGSSIYSPDKGGGGKHFLSTCCMLSDLFVCFFHPEGVVRKLPKWFLFPFFH